MFSGVLFFMYIFAGFAGVLVILLAVLLIRYWSNGNKKLLAAIRNFTMCTALIDFLYFWNEYSMLVHDKHLPVPALMRVADMCLFIGQVYFWIVYMREKSMLKEDSHKTKNRISLFCILICIVLAVIGYGCLMKDYYVASPGINRCLAVSMEIIMSILLTFVNLWYLMTAMAEVVQKKCRLYIICISVLLIINGTWNGILVIELMTERINAFIQDIYDPTPVFLLAINVVVMFLILGEDFTSLFKADGGENRQENDLSKTLNHIAEIHFLTEREREVLELAYRKMTNPEIADTLCISKYTVKNHMHNIFEKLDVSTRAELVHLIDERKDHKTAK